MTEPVNLPEPADDADIPERPADQAGAEDDSDVDQDLKLDDAGLPLDENEVDEPE